MPDLLNFKITPLASANVNVPRATIEAQIVDSSDQSVILFDFTGANAISFPGVVATLSAGDRLVLARLVAHWLLRNKAGLTDPLTGL